MNRPRVWVFPRNQRWFEEISRNPAMHDFYREYFPMNIESFQALCVFFQHLCQKETLASEQRYLQRSVWQLDCGVQGLRKAIAPHLLRLDNTLHLTLCSRIHSFIYISCPFCELPLPFNVLLCSLRRSIKISPSAFVQGLLFLLAVLAVDELSLVSAQFAVTEVNSIALPVEAMVQA